MRRILVVLLLFFATFLYAEDLPGDKLRADISEAIVYHMKYLDRGGMAHEGMLWSNVGWVHPNRLDFMRIDLVKGEEYVFYTMSDGPLLRTSCVYGDDKIFSKTDSYIIMRFKAKYTGEYKYYIHSIDQNKSGIQVSYFMKIFRRQ